MVEITTKNKITMIIFNIIDPLPVGSAIIIPPNLAIL
jgi:hypothetical protein